MQGIKPKVIRTVMEAAFTRNEVEGRTHNYGPTCLLIVLVGLLLGHLDDITFVTWDILWRGRSVTGPFFVGHFVPLLVLIKALS